jgi:peptidoglycan L-alanyl-D-glutamate endopeptidase CwlK
MYYLSKRSIGRLEGVDSRIISLLNIAIRHSPYDFGIPQLGGKRTPDDQYGLFVRGLSTKDGFIKLSEHQSGKAWDIYGYVNGRATWDADILEAIKNHIFYEAEKVGIELRWGGDWDGDGIRVDKDENENFFDGAHFELEN